MRLIDLRRYGVAILVNDIKEDREIRDRGLTLYFCVGRWAAVGARYSARVFNVYLGPFSFGLQFFDLDMFMARINQALAYWIEKNKGRVSVNKQKELLTGEAWVWVARLPCGCVMAAHADGYGREELALDILGWLEEGYIVTHEKGRGDPGEMQTRL